MSTDVQFQEFIENFRGELNRLAYGVSVEDARRPTEIFTDMVKNQLEDLGVLSDTHLCSYEHKTTKGNIRIDGYCFTDEYYFLNLITTIYKPHFGHGLTQTEIRQSKERAHRLFEIAKKKFYKDMEPSTDEYAMMQELWKRHEKVNKIKVILLTNGDVSRKIAEDMVDKDPDFDIWDMKRLFRSFDSNYEPIKIDFSKQFGTTLACLPLEHDTLGYKTFLAIIPGRILEGLYDAYGSRLLELNVRAFLQAKGKVNRGIRDTLKTEPQNFMAFNNGICATAEEVGLEPDERGQIKINTINGLQVVNGGQTMASIHRAGKMEKLPLEDVFVQAKITVIDHQQVLEFVPLISKYANSQNKVNDADFSSNDPYHVEIQRLSENIWTPGEQSRWFYERARGQYQVAKSRAGLSLAKKKDFERTTPASRKFTKTDLARFLNSWHMLPNIVSRGNQKNFVEFMSHLKKGHVDNWKPDTTYYRELIAKAIVYKRAQKIVRIRRDEILAFRVNVVNYLVSYLVFRSKGQIDLELIWKKQSVSNDLADILFQWSIEVYRAILISGEGRNISEWCKRPACWDAVKKIQLPLPDSVPEYNTEMESIAIKEGARREMTSEDREKLDMVIDHPKEIWTKIQAWSKAEKRLTRHQKNVIDSLIDLANENWSKLPSPKQVADAIKILGTWGDESDQE